MDYNSEDTGCANPEREWMGLKVTVIGAGSWGTTLACLLAENVEEVRLWGRNKDLMTLISTRRENPRYLPGHPLPPNIKAFYLLEEALSSCDLVVSVIPSHAVRSVFTSIGDSLPQVPVVSATKGIEIDTLKTVSAIMVDIFGSSILNRYACLSGPSFAKEVAKKIPTAITLASRNESLAKDLQKIFARPYFRVYTNQDVIGVEIGGALKNVIAIATGCSDGLGFGYNTRAALITRGLAEIKRLGVLLGAHESTFYGLSGIGDLVLTCTGDLSRNRTVGYKLGRGMKLEEIMEEFAKKGMVAEGIKTSRAAYELSQKYNVSMPITKEVYSILHEGKSVHRAVEDLLSREMREE